MLISVNARFLSMRESDSAPHLEVYRMFEFKKQHSEFRMLSERKLVCGDFATLTGVRLFWPTGCAF